MHVLIRSAFFIFGFVGLIYLEPVFAQYNNIPYVNGERFCDTKIPEGQRKFGFFVTVPVDYEHPEVGMTKIFVYSMRPFVSGNPTIIFVDGGPGAHSHSGPILPSEKSWAHPFRTKELNVLHFDQRGIACSRPSTEERFEDPDFYSTLNTVKDIERIRKYLKIERWTIYGHSYGTRPAIAYAHFFPRFTRGVLLESISAQNAESPSSTGERTRESLRMNFQSAIDKMPVQLRDEIIEVSKKNPKWEKVYLSGFLFNALNTFGLSSGSSKYINIVSSKLIQSGRENLPEQEMKQRFEDISSEVISALIPDDIKVLTEHFSEDDLVQLQEEDVEASSIEAVDSTVMHIMSCRELDSYARGLTSHFSISRGKVMVNVVSDGRQPCPGVFSSKRIPFELDQFPISTPAIIVSGENDMATPAVAAASFAKEFARGKTLYLSVNEAGHEPIRALLRMDGLTFISGPMSDSGAAFSDLLFKFISSGEIPTKEEMSEVREKTRWSIH